MSFWKVKAPAFGVAPNLNGEKVFAKKEAGLAVWADGQGAVALVPERSTVPVGVLLLTVGDWSTEG